jgi:hypothetical protein
MNMIDAEFIPQIYKLLPVCCSLIGASLSFLLYSYGKTYLFNLKKTF